jgi:vesicle transport protein SEC22
MSKTSRVYKDSRTAPTLPTAAPSASTSATSTSASAAGMSGPGGNLGRINDDLQDVTRIMTKNMEDLLWRGDSLDSESADPILGTPFGSRNANFRLDPTRILRLACSGMSHLSTSLRSESLKYRKQARNINLEAMLRQYAPVGVVGLIIVVFFWWRFF